MPNAQNPRKRNEATEAAIKILFVRVFILIPEIHKLDGHGEFMGALGGEIQAGCNSRT